YTLDGSTPDNTKTKYTTPIYINEIKTLKAISWYSSISKSNVVTYNYSITESHNGCFINVTCRTGTIHKGDILYQKIQNSNNQEYCYLNGLTTENSSNGIIEIELITGGTGKNGITQNFIIDNNFLSNVGTIYFFIDEKTSPIYINCYDILPHIDNNYTILYNVKLKQLDQFTFSYDTKPVIANRTYTNIPVNTDDWLLLGIVIFMLSIGCLIIINICIKVYSKNKKA
ncbi:chitobiase/beta-hexosaminidase C-terminal domain-containing protein, partial [Patescibacteria group bacterium]|nr:chitobiase/beta-hexosaminidase C-terminal domain-containing protein [Patescibacteria group bacterium]